MARTVRTGLVGCGGIGKTHALALASLPESTFAACCDLDGARARALAAEHGVPRVYTVLKIDERIDKPTQTLEDKVRSVEEQMTRSGDAFRRDRSIF